MDTACAFGFIISGNVHQDPQGWTNDGHCLCAWIHKLGYGLIFVVRRRRPLAGHVS